MSRPYAGGEALVSQLQCFTGCRPGTYTFYATQGDVSGPNFTCPSCAVGYVTRLFAETNCTPCAAGSYATDTIEAMRCQLSPAGFYQPDPGKTDYIPCPKGTTSIEGSLACTNCVAGTYNLNQSQSVCTPCPAGTFGEYEKRASLFVRYALVIQL